MKILVVDDEADVLPMFLQRFRKEIRNNELEFAFALSGFEALKYLQSTTCGRSLVISVNGEVLGTLKIFPRLFKVLLN
jgi:two-component system, chemotaxis family, chemotaxis protein CheY